MKFPLTSSRVLHHSPQQQFLAPDDRVNSELSQLLATPPSVWLRLLALAISFLVLGTTIIVAWSQVDPKAPAHALMSNLTEWLTKGF